MRDFDTMPVYQGARHESGQQPGSVHSRDLTNPAIMEGAAAVQRNLEALEASFKRNEDAAQAMEEDAAMRQVEARYSAAFDEKLQLANGAEGSLFNADGTRNEVEFNNFMTDYRREIEGVTRGKYWTPQVGIAASMKRESRLVEFPLQLEAQRGRHTRQRGLKAFSDAYDLALAQENYGDARAAVDVAFNAGLISADEAQLHRLKAGRAALRGRVSSGGTVNVGGEEYSGFEAALASQAARDGVKLGADAEMSVQEASAHHLTMNMPIAPEAPLPFLAGHADSETQAKPGAYTLQMSVLESEAPPPVIVGEPGIALNTVSAGLSPADLLEQRGDFSGIIRTLPASEYTAMSDALIRPLAVGVSLRGDGTTEFTASPLAPEAMQRTVAQANVEGGINLETGRACIANVVMAEVRANRSITVPQLVDLFDGSGLFEAFGEGDAALGKEAVRAVCAEFRERALHGATQLNLDNVERLVTAHVNAPAFGAGQEWKQMESLRPPASEDGLFQKPGDEAGRRHWFALFAVYNRYRDEFNPQHPAGEATKEEFAEKAFAFYKWYMGGSGKYRTAKKNYTDAARDWLMAECMNSLKAGVGVGTDGQVQYQGTNAQGKAVSYASEVHLVLDLLGRVQIPPDVNSGVAAMENRLRDDAARDRALSAAWRGKAQPHAAQLRTWKEGRAEQAAVAEDASKRDAWEREAQLEAEIMEAEQRRKEEARRAGLRQAQERHRVRSIGWVWDGKRAGEGARPSCTIPETEAAALEEMGYDGSQLVYVSINGADVLVVGTHKGNAVRLNSVAASKVQPKRKKGAPVLVKGTLEYSYRFKKAD